MDKQNSNLYDAECLRHQNINNSLLACLRFCIMNSQRNPEFYQNNILSRLADDIIQSVFAIEIISKLGIRNTCRRELRYLIEMAIKICYIQQKSPSLNVSKKLETYKDVLGDTNISLKKRVSLHFMGQDLTAEFLEETGRLYGLGSAYVHLSKVQIDERIKLVMEGVSIGNEGVEELKALNDELARVYSVVLVFILHAMDRDVVGDFFIIGSNGKIKDWYFNASRYVASIDSAFDYKAERQSYIHKLTEEREAKIRF